MLERLHAIEHAAPGRRRSPPRRRARTRESSGLHLAALTGGFLVLLAGANLATPLYAVYGERFGFSSAVLTLVFATYALVLVPSLLFFGRLSDAVGRRVVLLGGLGVAIAGLVLFALARGTPWLFAARAAQGVAVGAVSGTATAALVEFDARGGEGAAGPPRGLGPGRRERRGGAPRGRARAVGSLPRTLPFLVGSAATVLVGAAILPLPEPAPSARGRWRIQRPRVPREARARFAHVSVTGAAVWSVAALFLSVVPTYAGTLLHTRNLALLAALAALLLVASCAAQAAAHRGLAPARPVPVGLGLLAAGLLSLVLAFPLGSLALVIAAALLAGVGHGYAFLGAQAELNAIAPGDRRGEVTAAFATCIYLGVALPVIGVGCSP